VKWDPARVAQEMEIMVQNGSFVFDYTEWLTSNQIKSYFSRMAAKQRLQQQTPQTSSSAVLHTSTPTTFIDSDQKLLTTPAIRDVDEIEDDDEEVDDRELIKYSWRQMLDEAKDLLDKCLDSSSDLLTQSASCNSSSNTNVSMKRKSTAAIPKVSKNKRK